MAAGPARRVLDLGREAVLLPPAPEREAPPAEPASVDAKIHRLPFDAPAERRFSFAHSYFVQLLKILLPATALALAALVLLWPHINPDDRRFRLRPVAVSIDDLENLRMVSPRFTGVDAQSQPFVLTAEQATQDTGNSDLTDLAKPKADMTLKSGAWVALTANEGRYAKSKQQLELWGKVNLFHDTGYELQTSRAVIELENGRARGDEPVTGQGPGSELSGEGFRLYDKGAQIVVTGKSRVVLYPQGLKKQ